MFFTKKDKHVYRSEARDDLPQDDCKIYNYMQQLNKITIQAINCHYITGLQLIQKLMQLWNS